MRTQHDTGWTRSFGVFALRFFDFAFACPLYSVWRAVGLLVRVELTGEREHAPMATGDTALTLPKTESGTI